MNAPLSLFLTRFSADPPVHVAAPLPPLAIITLTAEDLEARLEAAGADARLEAQRDHETEVDTRLASDRLAAEEALAAARTEWCESEGGKLSVLLSQGLARMQDMLAERLATILRPVVSDALLQRSKLELREALDRLLADPTSPSLSVRGPADLIAALQDGCPSTGIDWVVTDTCDILVLADATRVETCLGAVLAALTERNA